MTETRVDELARLDAFIGDWAMQADRPGAGLRLYRATADSYSILAKDGRPDHRISVPLT